MRAPSLVGRTLLVLVALGAAEPSTPRTATRIEAIELPRPEHAGRDEDGLVRVAVTEPGRVVAEASWEPARVPLELTVSKWTTPACTQRGTGRAQCAVEVTREDLARVGGLYVVRAHVAPLSSGETANGALVVSYPVPELRVEEHGFPVPGTFRTTFHARRVGPIALDVDWAREEGETPPDGCRVALELQGPYVEGYGRTSLSSTGHLPLHLEHVARSYDLVDDGRFVVAITGRCPEGARPATAALRIAVAAMR